MRELVKRQTAELTTDKRGKQISSRVGTYSNGITIALAKKFKGKVVSVRQIAKVQYGRTTDHNEKYVRRKLFMAARMLLRSGVPAFVVYSDEGQHKVTGIKLISEWNEEDVATLTVRKTEMVARGEITLAAAELVDKAVEALRNKQPDKPAE